MSSVRNIKLTTVDDIFSTEASRQAEQAASLASQPPSFQPVSPNTKQIVELPLDDLFAFKGHVFQIREDNEMAELVQSVADYGVRQPVQVRPRSVGG